MRRSSGPGGRPGINVASAILIGWGAIPGLQVSGNLGSWNWEANALPESGWIVAAEHI